MNYFKKLSAKALIAAGVMLIGSVSFGQEVTKSLADLGAFRGPLRLTTWQSGYNIKVPVSPREAVYGAMLHLETVNSTALIKSRSELSVRVNDKIVGQYPLDPVSTKASRDILIPGNLLRTGYNDVVVGVVQHYTYDCEDPASPELWTEIDAVRSTVTLGLDGQIANESPRLSQLDTVFDKKGWLPKKLAVVVGTSTVSKDQLRAASLAVQGIALRMGYRPIDIEVFTNVSSSALSSTAQDGDFPNLNPSLFQDRDVLLIGTNSDLNMYMGNAVGKYPEMAKPYVGTFSANQGNSMIVVVTGSDSSEVITAAKSLANPKFKYSDAIADNINVEDPLAPPYIAKVRTEEKFSNFGYTTTFSRGMKVQPISMEFRAPSDYSARAGDKVKLVLHFAYGAGLRKDSSMSIFLNGNPANAVPLNDEKGGEFGDYRIELPAQYVKPGKNTLVFEPVFLAHKDRCDMIRDEHLLLTLYEDSTIELPRDTAPIMVPDLQRTAQGVWPIQDKLQIQVLSTDLSTVAAVLKFSALIAQKYTAPVDVYLDTKRFSSGPVVVIGGYSQLPADLKFVNIKGSWAGKGSEMVVAQGMADNQIYTAFLASSPETLNTAMSALSEKGLWDGLSGAASIVNTTDFTLTTQPADNAVKVLGIKEKLTLKYGLSDSKKLIWALEIALVLFAIAFVAVLRVRAKRRQRAEQDTVLMEDM